MDDWGVVACPCGLFATWMISSASGLLTPISTSSIEMVYSHTSALLLIIN